MSFACDHKGPNDALNEFNVIFNIIIFTTPDKHQNIRFTGCYGQNKGTETRGNRHGQDILDINMSLCTY